ncbi:metallophosphoesterase [Campylobacter novaezeelandiae]|uniref:metallophosphoesterase n=2 Tax=Campylobacter novaezeelandiae TaxID=2267891 RepID=UPI001905753A|nr:metallophosphoesterase [Campylobacter novaezeelandiae]MBK1964082.1 metallophosphoesterase [Campylobacter novaezeelandiae]
MLAFIFFFTILFIFALANVYIYKRLITRISFFKYLHNFFKYFFILLYISQAFFFLLRKEDFLTDKVYEILALSFAPTYCFFFITLFLDFIKFICIFSGKNYSIPYRFLRIIFEIFILVLGGFLTYISINNALKIPNVKKEQIYIDNLKQDLKIAMLTDIHLGKNLHKDFLEKLIIKTNALNPDLIVIVGDLVDTDVEHLKDYIGILNEFKSKFGTFYVLGNHEYYHNVNEVLQLLNENTNMHILLNKNIDLGVINIAGIGDLMGLRQGVYGPDLDKVQKDLSKDKPSILLSHQPKTVLLYNVNDFDLILSGHTHAGQIFPFGVIVKLNQGFLHGLYHLNEKTKLYVSSGAGFWGPSLRVFAPSEIVLLELKGKR